MLFLMRLRDLFVLLLILFGVFSLSAKFLFLLMVLRNIPSLRIFRGCLGIVVLWLAALGVAPGVLILILFTLRLREHGDPWIGRRISGLKELVDSLLWDMLFLITVLLVHVVLV